jgi:hypothetical protein
LIVKYDFLEVRVGWLLSCYLQLSQSRQVNIQVSLVSKARHNLYQLKSHLGPLLGVPNSGCSSLKLVIVGVGVVDGVGVGDGVGVLEGVGDGVGEALGVADGLGSIDGLALAEADGEGSKLGEGETDGSIQAPA